MRKTARIWSFILFSCLALGAARVWAADSAPESTTAEPAQDGASTEEAPSGAAEEPAAPVEEETASVEVTAPGNVTVDFKDADIHNVLRILSFKSGVNIVAGKDVSGTVTIRLVDVPWEKALDVILKTYGYAYDRQENVIRVATVENLNREELSTEVFVLNYTRAADVEKSVTEMLSERGKVRSDTRSNMLIVTDMPTSIQNVRTVISRLDQATPQVLIEAKVIELSLGTVDKLGINWNISASLRGAKRPTSIPWPAVQRTGLSSIYPYGRSSQVNTDLDTNEQQIVEDFPKGKGGAGLDSIQPTFPVADKSDFTFGSIDFTEFRVLVDAILNRTDAKVLSEPHVTVLNNQEAKILVGEIIAIPTFERNPSTGRMEITGYQDRDLGVRLVVVPQVNNENEIVVTVHPEITALLGYDELTEEIRAPRFSTREAVTNVRIKSGQTIAIGGLIKEDFTDVQSKVPLLGDLPFVDRLFGYSGKTMTRTDLLFFMTVTVIKDAVPTGHKL